MTNSLALPRGVGVDVVAISRTDDFYRKHRDSLRKILNDPELKQVEDSGSPARMLAYFFSAKEAVFKSLDQNWLGVEGFRMIEIGLPSEHEMFGAAKLSGVMKEKAAGRIHEWRVQFLETDDFVISQAIAF